MVPTALTLKAHECVGEGQRDKVTESGYFTAAILSLDPSRSIDISIVSSLSNRLKLMTAKDFFLTVHFRKFVGFFLNNALHDDAVVLG